MDLATVTAADFEPLLHQAFALDESDGAALTLVEIDSRAADGNDARSAFTLIFRAAEGIDSPQGIFQLSHAHTGEFELFLVPLGLEGGHMMYQAVFA
ncbi:MAG: hypothetical protein R3228_03540 [Halioglobus sp.]|nr:hypothetical protein [Halioglobus sp.]